MDSIAEWKMTQENIKELEDIKIKLSKQKNTEKRLGREQKRVSETYETIQKNPVFLSFSQRKGKRDWMQQKICEEIVAQNFPSMVKEINLYVQAAQDTPNRINPNKILPRRIIIKLKKTKNKRKGRYQIVTKPSIKST